MLKNYVKWMAVTLLCWPLSLFAENDFTSEHRVEREAVANLKAYAHFKAGDHDAARAIWEELAAAGNTTAMWNLANLLQQKYSDPEEQQKALSYILEAAEAGDPRAQHELGIAYEKGELLDRDLQQAAEWLRRAAEQNYTDSQLALGILLATEFGQGVENVSSANRRDALMWLNRAAQDGCFEARNYIEILDNEPPDTK